ncbi:MAG: M48 family metallopeptidase [Candidatus Zixiibacteriota bacterium]
MDRQSIPSSSRFAHSYLFAIMTLVALILSCATTGPGGKKSFIFIPTSQEVALGQGMADELKKSETTLPDPEWQAYLAEVGQKIVAVSDRKDIEYHFTVIESDVANAFAAPGGYVYFYTGLLREMSSEAEMAAVMAHEISHVVARHGVKRVQTSLGAALAYELAFGGSKESSKALQAAIAVGLNLCFSSYSREAEREADNFGIQYMVKAGYDPQGAVAMFNVLAGLGDRGEANVFEKMMSSHPETQERIKNAKTEISAMTLPPELSLGKDRYQKMVKRLPAKKAAK